MNNSLKNIILYLASASPRRRELLTQIGVRHQVLAQDIDESQRAAEPAEDYVCRMAKEKAEAALRDPLRQSGVPVLAADTSVVCDEHILGKPLDSQHAFDMLSLLSGREHVVMTAVALADDSKSEHCLVTTRVRFRDISPGEIAAYWQSKEPLDKAGAYAIQGLGAMFVSDMQGSYSSVVGLPLFESMQLLENFGITAEAVLKESST